MLQSLWKHKCGNRCQMIPEWKMSIQMKKKWNPTKKVLEDKKNEKKAYTVNLMVV